MSGKSDPLKENIYLQVLIFGCSTVKRHKSIALEADTHQDEATDAELTVSSGTSLANMDKQPETTGCLKKCQKRWKLEQLYSEDTETMQERE